jgi:hypothetical protein
MRVRRLGDMRVRPFGITQQNGPQVQGGGILYSVVKASDFYTSDVEKHLCRRGDGISRRR